MNLREHLTSRWFDPALYSGVFLDDEFSCATFMLWNLSGQACGYQTYSPLLPKVHVDNPREAKYFTWVSKGQNVCWGLETLKTLDTSVVYLTEGVFDACRLHWHGKAALAMLTNKPDHLRNWLSCLPYRTVAATQGDRAGQKLAKFADSALYLPNDHDVGSLSEDYFAEAFGL